MKSRLRRLRTPTAPLVGQGQAVVLDLPALEQGQGGDAEQRRRQRHRVDRRADVAELHRAQGQTGDGDRHGADDFIGGAEALGEEQPRRVDADARRVLRAFSDQIEPLTGMIFPQD